jgi:hypothetical protein
MKIRARKVVGGGRRRGFVLITAMWIAIALSAVVLVLCREMAVESLTARQHLAQAKADMAEIGVEQFVMSVVEQELVTPGYKNQVLWQSRQIGECYFWVLTPNPDDETTPAYGLTDEGGKIDINYAPEVMLEYLPGLETTPSIAAAIVDWRDTDDDVTQNINTGAEGNESNFYQSTYGYNAKNNLFESLDELRLVAGLTDPTDAAYVLWGTDTNHNYVIEASEAAVADPGMNFLNTMRGMMPYVTVYGYQATNPPAVSATVDSLGNIGTSTTTQPSTLDEITYLTPLDINTAANVQGNNSMLAQLLNQYISGNVNAIMTATAARIAPTAQRGQTATATPFTSIWDWINTVNANGAQNITSQDLSVTTSDGTPLFCLLACVVPPATTSTTTTTTAPDTTPTTTNPTGALPQTKFAKLNVNTALLPALFSVFAYAEQQVANGATQTTMVQDPDSAALQDAQNVILTREQYPTTLDNSAQLPNISWLMDTIDPQVLVAAGPYITGTSTVYSADIVTVTQDGRAFKRVKIVVDASAMYAAQVANANSNLSGATGNTGNAIISGSSGTASSTGPVIVYRRDLTAAGWPIDPEVRRALRRGELPLQASTNTGSAATGNSLTFGP